MMSRVLGLIFVSWITVGLTGCVGPMGPGCRGMLGGSCATNCDGSSCEGCNSCTGCGELYVDPWINHRADCVDPCNSCGNYNGQSCGKCRSMLSGVKSIWGYRCGCGPAPIPCSKRSFAPDCSSNCDGCDSCCSEPTCGCEGPCDCSEPVCGLEPVCGCEAECTCEPACGSEPVCGCESGCTCEPVCGCEGGCNCGSTMSESYGPVQEGYIVEPPAEVSSGQAVMPSQSGRIFTPRPSTASRGGFLNNHRR